MIRFEQGIAEQGYVLRIYCYGGQALMKGAPPYARIMQDYFGDLFPGSKIGLLHHPDQGGSWYGAFRAERGGNICIEFLDFAPDDYGRPKEEVVDAWEGLLRSLSRSRPEADFVFCYTLHPEMLKDFEAGKTPVVIQWAEEIAVHYNASSVNLAQYAFDRIKAGDVKPEEFFAENAIPTRRGAEIYADGLRLFLDKCVAMRKPEDKVVARKLPPEISATNMHAARMFSYDLGDWPRDWKPGRTSPSSCFLHVLEGTPSDDVFSFAFRGSKLGMLDWVDQQTGTLEYSVDGSDWTTLKPGEDKPHVRLTRLAEGLDPQKDHVLKLRMPKTQASPDKVVHIGQFLVDGRSQDRFAEMSPLERADAVYATMDPIDYEPPKDRWSRIPRTMKTLHDGGELRIVLLGDSIIGDTCSSDFERVLERVYPKCKITKIVSVRGGTGCWWYKDDNRIEDYVLRHKPDLLIIGGIS